MSDDTFNVELQGKILALMAQDRMFLSQNHEYLKPFYFDSAIMVDISRIILDYYRKFRTNPSPVALADCMANELNKLKRKNIPEYFDMVESMYSDSIPERDYLKEVVLDFVQYQEIRNAIMDSVGHLKNKDFEKIKQLMIKAFHAGTMRDQGINYFDVDAIEGRMCEQSVLKVPTGLPEVDKYLGGGAGPGELGIILGAPNVGKSIMLTVIGAGGLRLRKKVFHATMEMSGEKVALRYDYNLTGKNKSIIKDSTKEVLAFLEQFQRNMKCNLHIKQWPTRTATVGVVKAYLEYLAADGFIPDELLIDYAAIMKPSTKRDGRHQEIEEINEELRGLAGELGIPVWTVAQTNSAGVGKAVLNIDDLGESFAQSKVADVVLSICQTKAEYAENKIRLFFAKNRDDKKFASLPYNISYDLMRLRYAPESA